MGGEEIGDAFVWGTSTSRFIGIFLSSSPRDLPAPCDSDRTELDIALPIVHRGVGT